MPSVNKAIQDLAWLSFKNQQCIIELVQSELCCEPAIRRMCLSQINRALSN